VSASTEARRHRFYLAGLGLLFAAGIFLRLPPDLFSEKAGLLHKFALLHPQPKWTEMGTLGMDEGLYSRYVDELSEKGLLRYPDIALHYLEVQIDDPGAILPPVRFLFIFSAYLWHLVFRSEALASLSHVASVFSILTLFLSGLCAWRLKGPACALGVVALMTCAPTQIHMSQHAVIDGFFTFWALLCLWTLWENLRAPRDWRWILAYTLALTFLVLTKENSFFVCVALVALIVANRWLQFGTVTRELLVGTIIGPLFGIVILIFLTGGADVLVATYRLLVMKASHAPYAILTGDGPWYRYLVDLFLVSPVILLLALGAAFRLNRIMKPELFMSIFIAASYLIMCNVKYGMNLRYANMWDMPLRLLAFSQIAVLTASVKRYRILLISVAVAVIAAMELRQYYILAVRYPLYELITHELLRALQILKYPSP
jgi:4-amino-4-deoxy-L-arabinose transferase-like glycosyltransferase